MGLTAHLSFSGQCREAFSFYAELFSVLVDVEGVEKARRIFTALADGGSVSMPVQETFWSPAFGVVVDRFGIPWEINGK